MPNQGPFLHPATNRQCWWSEELQCYVFGDGTPVPSQGSTVQRFVRLNDVCQFATYTFQLWKPSKERWPFSSLAIAGDPSLCAPVEFSVSNLWESSR